MGFTEVQDLDTEITTALGGFNKKTGKPNPKQAEGYFLGSKSTTNKKSKTGFSKLHILQTEKGNLGVWGKTDLDRKLLAVEVGTMIRITQDGMKSTENGDMYKFKVEQDKSNTIKVEIRAQETVADDTEESYESNEVVEDDYVVDEPALPQPARPSRAATPPSAANQARVQALLSGNRNKS